MKILLLEDDPDQSSAIQRAIAARLKGAVVQIIETEHEFREAMAKLGNACPWSLVISDVMMPWAYPGTNAPDAPAEVMAGTFRRAGTRCWTEFRRKTGCQTIPWIYFTVLDETSAGFKKRPDKHTDFVQKGESINPLLIKINTALENSAHMARIFAIGKKTPLSRCSTKLP